MSTRGLCEKFVWSTASEPRNELTHYYEPIQPFILLSLTRRLSRAVFVDAGANIGFYTVVVGCEPTLTEVYAFEPMPSAASALRWNSEANIHGKPVVVREVALSDHAGDLEFAVISPLAGDNGALADTTHDRSEIEVQRVRSARLDDEVRASGRDIVIKVDVEGHELSLLRGATRVLSENRGFLQIEMHESPSLSERIAFLNDLGWHQLARVGPDYFFSNIPTALSEASRAEVFEQAMGLLLEESKSPQRAWRRRIVPGIYLEVSRRRSDAVKSLLRR